MIFFNKQHLGARRSHDTLSSRDTTKSFKNINVLGNAGGHKTKEFGKGRIILLDSLERIKESYN